MKDVPRHEQLFVLMDANARTGRREKGGVGSKDNKSLGAYGRDTLNKNGELLLSQSRYVFLSRMLQPRHIMLVINMHFGQPRAVKDVPRHEQLFVLMDANARTGRREKGGVGSKDNKSIGTYGRDTLNDNGELLLSFVNKHDLAIVNTFFSTPKGGVSHTFKGRGKKRIDYILTRQRDRILVRNVTVHPQSSFLPISDHNIVSVPVKLPRPFCSKPPAEGLS